MTKDEKDEEAVAAARHAIYQFSQYTYTLSAGQILKVVQAVDSVRCRQAKEMEH